MNRKKIILGSGIVTFIVGFVLISLASWFLNMAAGQEGDIELRFEFISVMGLWTLLGLALVAIGGIVILLIKFDKVNCFQLSPSF